MRPPANARAGTAAWAAKRLSRRGLLGLAAGVLAAPLAAGRRRVAGQSAGEAVSPPGRATPVRGANVYVQSTDANDLAGFSTLLTGLAGLGVDTLLLTFPIYINGPTGSRIERLPQATPMHPEAASPMNAQLQAQVDLARAAGFAVWLRPFLDETILNASNTWRGELAPGYVTGFFTNYSALLKHLILGVTGVDWLVIGTEFGSLQQPQYDDRWRALIADLRGVTTPRGLKLTYARNWNSDPFPETPPWFADLDGLAIDAWYPAGDYEHVIADTAPRADITAGLAAWRDDLLAIRASAPGLPLFLTELGVASQGGEPNVLMEPWQWPDPARPVNLAIQADYATAACDFYTAAQDDTGAPLVDGIFWWMASVTPPADPATDRSFAFLGKPVASVITGCFAGWGR